MKQHTLYPIYCEYVCCLCTLLCTLNLQLFWQYFLYQFQIFDISSRYLQSLPQKCFPPLLYKHTDIWSIIYDYRLSDCSAKMSVKYFFYDTIVAKQLYRKLSLYTRFIYCRNLKYLTYGNIWLILYTVRGLASSEVLWGVGIISSQVFGHLRSFKSNKVI